MRIASHAHRRPWTEQEDQLVLAAVDRCQHQHQHQQSASVLMEAADWKSMEAQVPGRSRHQIKERWNNHLVAGRQAGTLFSLKN